MGIKNAWFYSYFNKKCEIVVKSGWKWLKNAYVCLGETLTDNQGKKKTTTTVYDFLHQ